MFYRSNYVTLTLTILFVLLVSFYFITNMHPSNSQFLSTIFPCIVINREQNPSHFNCMCQFLLTIASVFINQNEFDWIEKMKK